MGNLSERDRNVFRILFESEPYDFDSEYERKQADLREDRGPLDAPAQTRAARKGERDGTTARNAQRLVPRPAGAHRHGRPQVRQHPLDPARDQQAADAAHGFLRHAHPPFLQDAAIASGRGLHHSRGSRVFATADGTVREVALRNSTQGQTVVIDHGNGYETRTTTSRRSTSARASRCAGATSSPSRATRAFRWPPTSTTKCGSTACASTRSTTSSWS